MSMPQPIHVALIGSSAEVVRSAKKHFRLSAPGIGAAYLVSLDGKFADLIGRLSDVPTGLVHVWVALDKDALAVAQNRYGLDANSAEYDRGFYDDSLPEACILIDYNRSPSAAKKQLAELAQKIIKAWYDSS